MTISKFRCENDDSQLWGSRAPPEDRRRFFLRLKADKISRARNVKKINDENHLTYKYRVYFQKKITFINQIPDSFYYFVLLSDIRF